MMNENEMSEMREMIESACDVLEGVRGEGVDVDTLMRVGVAMGYLRAVMSRIDEKSEKRDCFGIRRDEKGLRECYESLKRMSERNERFVTSDEREFWEDERDER